MVVHPELLLRMNRIRLTTARATRTKLNRRRIREVPPPIGFSRILLTRGFVALAVHVNAGPEPGRGGGQLIAGAGADLRGRVDQLDRGIALHLL